MTFPNADIAFIVNPSLWYKKMYPGGILFLSNYLTTHGYHNTIIDSAISTQKIPFYERKNKLLEYLEKYLPQIICFSSTHKEFSEVVAINNCLKITAKKSGKKIFTIVGGPQPTYRASDYLDHGFDFVCIGEGEKTLLAFVQEIDSKQYRWHKIDGIAWRGDGVVTRNPPRSLMSEQELNLLEFSAYKKISQQHFDFNIETIRGIPLRTGMILTTRGCPFSCTFCGCPSIFGHKLRFRPLQSIEQELAFLQEQFQIEGVWIIDDTFTMNREHAFAVSDLLKKYNLLWGCQSRVDDRKEEFIQYFKKSGCVQIDFGVESGSQRILDQIIRKKIKVSDVKHTFTLTKKYKIRSLANFMIGLPTETAKDLQATKELAKAIQADVYVFSIAIPLPGTKLYEMVGESISPLDYNALDWNGSDLINKVNKSEISNLIEERQKLKRKYLLRSMIKSTFSLSMFSFLLFKNYRYKRIVAICTFIFKNFLSAPRKSSP
ncbi:MAG: B12-binding domain-containing radical SAM protein [Oligoflexia bacterium]|nr:B12-binding domain-containing radical SAM protein [Oligoflexia bacterium]MBF0365799.1 B12-binding domain-containing radical SAM protein [Oligoflexia bacterium]